MSNHNAFSIKKAALVTMSLSFLILLSCVPLTKGASTQPQPTDDVTLTIKGGWKLHLIVQNPTQDSFEASFTLKFHNAKRDYNRGGSMLILPGTTTDCGTRPPLLFGTVYAVLSALNQTISQNGTIFFGYTAFHY
jgi:hypothetical protein